MFKLPKQFQRCLVHLVCPRQNQTCCPHGFWVVSGRKEAWEMEQGLRPQHTILAVNRTELLSCSMVAGWILQDITEGGKAHFRGSGRHWGGSTWVLGWRASDDQPVLFPFWGLCHVACRILVPWPGSTTWPLQWKHGVIATRLPRNPSLC